jgi:hypothetical protein
MTIREALEKTSTVPRRQRVQLVASVEQLEGVMRTAAREASADDMAGLARAIARAAARAAGISYEMVDAT